MRPRDSALTAPAERAATYIPRDRLASQPKEHAWTSTTRPQQAEYRQKVRAWLQEHKAQAPEARSTRAGAEDDAYVDARRRWQGQLAEGGLAGVTWPVDVGGQGLGPIEQVIVSQEIARAGVPGILDVIGVGMLGPTIIAHGTEEQKGALPRRRCSTATRSGASSSPSRPPARTSRRCRRARARRTTARGCSTARRCGRPTRSSPPSACCWRAPTPSSTSTRA